ncbi:hypothetical protein MPTK1_7g00280 [Marchantia polymorpha subsp. ruderalis]|uniref:Uncharacterized protein n=2 Tax=Marchantia polymorpha TaxID=3197 RepID=A0AAF6BUP0_MARPO|nr:hypothetical protein MARPO_0046s0096 [Marchantia polymorpha]BBN15724.1 hypothetical protein Mp_7g00280 [Marchantia polymorpha subsp. ruderalis]|eukprot:PTQ39283.1 hypothetical protein MARPO_0046s0096 [Marchantia polymorpha]
MMPQGTGSITFDGMLVTFRELSAGQIKPIEPSTEAYEGERSNYLRKSATDKLGSQNNNPYQYAASRQFHT